MNLLRCVSILLALFFVSGCGKQTLVETPSAQIEAGWDAYRLGEYKRAIECFEAASRSGAGTDAEAHALYGLASTWNLRRPGNDPIKAAAIYEKIIASAKTPAAKDVAAWSSLALARMKHLVGVDEQPDYPAVREAYQACIDQFPGHPAADEAFIHQQSTYLAALAPQDAQVAAERLEKFVAERSDSPLLSAAWLLLAEARQILCQPEASLAARIRSLETLEEDETNPTDKALTYWKIATVAEFDAGDFATARKYYNLLISEYDNDIRLFASRAALKRMDELEATLIAERAERTEASR
ncbi:MAG TPA: tetratricopeptide repeat protein [Planctomycetota bacterium]|nr:tetratricopeptide repeat protein [Planctomycetota bacterium]